MRNDKQKAIELRKSGKSYSAIANALKVPKSTLSNWLSDLEWSAEVKTRLAREAQALSTVRLVELDRTRGVRLKAAYEEARKEAVEELATLKYNPLFIAGVMLYAGEGSRSPRDGVKFASADPGKIACFVAFLQRACGIPSESIRGSLLLYPDLEERISWSYWSKISSIHADNFTKTTLLKPRKGIRKLNWGVCQVTVSNRYFKRKMLEWVKLLPKELIDTGYYANIGNTPEGESAAMV